MLRNEVLFVFCGNVFRLKQIWLWKNQAGAAATVLSGFLAELEVQWDRRQSPEEPQLTSALCPISSLPVTRVHYCSSSRGHTLPVSGWNLFWTSVLLGLQYWKKKKSQSLTLQIRRFHIKFPLSSFSWKLKICNSSWLGAVFKAEERLPLYSPPVPKVSTQLAHPHRLLACFLCATEFLIPALPSQRWRPKGAGGLTVLTPAYSFPSNNGK